MCLKNIRVKWQLFGKRKFAYKVFNVTSKGNLETYIAGMPVRKNTKVWQSAYQRVPFKVKCRVIQIKVHKGKISVFLNLRSARKWSTSSQIWLVEIKYDKLLVGKQYRFPLSLKGALVDEFRLVKQVT